jgi:hypothetical protein
MRKKGNIHALVHALTKTEKRYVKVFAKLHGDNLNYIKLLDAIEEQVQYDENAIKVKFREEPFTKQLHVTKNYLQSLILKALRNFYHYPLSRAELLDMLRNIEILFEKGLKDHVEFYLLKGIRWSKEIECFDLQLSFLDWQKKWLQSFWSDAFREHSKFMDRDFQACLKNLMNLDQYRHLYDSMDKLLSGSRVTVGYFSDEVIGSSLMESGRKAQSVRARIIYYKILFRYHYVHKNSLHRGINEGKKLIELGKDNRQLLIHHLEDFLEGMWSMIRALFRNKEVELLQEFLSEMSKIFQSLQKGQSFSNIHINQLEILSWQLRVLEFAPEKFKKSYWEREFRKEVESHKAKSFSKSLAKALLIKAWKEYYFGEYEECKKYCSQILEEFNYPIYAPYRNAALMFNLLLALKSNRVPSLKMNFNKAKSYWLRDSKGPLSNRRKVFGSIISGNKDKWKDLISKAVQVEKRKQDKQFLSGINEKEVFIFFAEQYITDA